MMTIRAIASIRLAMRDMACVGDGCLILLFLAGHGRIAIAATRWRHT